MNKRSEPFIYATIIGLVIVITLIGFFSGFNNPIAWLLIAALLLIPLFYKAPEQPIEIQWKDEYSVGIKHIDDDHKKLITLLNKFTVAYDREMSEKFEKEALESLVDYTKYHFKREEKMMRDNEYPNFVAHQAKHEEMIDQVNKFIDLYDEKGHAALKDISEYLTVWLITHINGTDKDYSDYLNAKGIE